MRSSAGKTRRQADHDVAIDIALKRRGGRPRFGTTVALSPSDVRHRILFFVLFATGCPSGTLIDLADAPSDPRPFDPEVEVDCTNEFVREDPPDYVPTSWITGFDDKRRVVRRARTYDGKTFEVRRFVYGDRQRIERIDRNDDRYDDEICTFTLEDSDLDIPRSERCETVDGRLISEARSYFGPFGLMRYESDTDGDGVWDIVSETVFDEAGNIRRNVYNGRLVAIHEYEDGRLVRWRSDSDEDGDFEYLTVYRTEGVLEIQETFKHDVLVYRVVRDPDLGIIEALDDLERGDDDDRVDTRWRYFYAEGLERVTADFGLDGTQDALSVSVFVDGHIQRNTFESRIPGYIESSTTTYAYDALGRDLRREHRYHAGDFDGFERMAWRYGCAWVVGATWPP